MEIEYKTVVSLCLAYLLLAVFLISFIMDTGGSNDSQFMSIMGNTPDFNNIDVSELIGVSNTFTMDYASGYVNILGVEINVPNWSDNWLENISIFFEKIIDFIVILLLIIGYVIMNIFNVGGSLVSCLVYLVAFFIWVVGIFSWVGTSDFINPLVKVFLIVPPTVLFAYLIYQIVGLVRGK